MKSPHLQFLRVKKLLYSNPTSSNTTSLNTQKGLRGSRLPSPPGRRSPDLGALREHRRGGDCPQRRLARCRGNVSLDQQRCWDKQNIADVYFNVEINAHNSLPASLAFSFLSQHFVFQHCWKYCIGTNNQTFQDQVATPPRQKSNPKPPKRQTPHPRR